MKVKLRLKIFNVISLKNYFFTLGETENLKNMSSS